MARKLNAKVIMAKCSKTRKTFGIRIEQRGGDWVRTWAFPMDERKAKREGYDAAPVTGSMDAAEGYPGCPHCGSTAITMSVPVPGAERPDDTERRTALTFQAAAISRQLQ